MFEILNYVLIGTQIAAMLMCCFLCGLHIGDFIIKKKIEKQDIISPPVRIEDMHLNTPINIPKSYPTAQKVDMQQRVISNHIPTNEPTIVFEVYEQNGDDFVLYASHFNKEYKMMIPNANFHTGDIIAVTFDNQMIYYEKI